MSDKLGQMTVFRRVIWIVYREADAMCYLWRTNLAAFATYQQAIDWIYEYEELHPNESNDCCCVESIAFND